MTSEKLLEIVALYREALVSMGTEPKKMDENTVVKETTDRKMLMSHALWAVDRVPIYITGGHLNVANQWLGFVQGMLLMLGAFTIEEMRQHAVED